MFYWHGSLYALCKSPFYCSTFILNLFFPSSSLKGQFTQNFTHPQVVANLDFFLLLNAKEDILKNIVRTKQLMGPIDFHSIFFPSYTPK